MAKKPSAQGTGGNHLDTALPPHADINVHIDTPAGPHIDTGGQHVDASAGGVHQDVKLPHADTQTHPHIDAPRHVDTPAGPHADVTLPTLAKK